jgi:hypothetical protein
VGANASGYLSLDYPKLTAFLLEVAKSQQQSIVELRERTELLEQQVHGARALAPPLAAVVASAGPGAGTGARVLVSGDGHSGTLSVTTGSQTASGALVEVALGRSLPRRPRIVLTPTEPNSAELRYFARASADRFSVNVTQAPRGEATFEFDYLVVE